MSLNVDAATYTYAQVEHVVGSINGIFARRSALEGRLKHLKKLGFPGGVNTGRGKRVPYTAPQLTLIALATEFAQFGILPEQTVKLMRHRSAEIIETIGQVVSGAYKGPPGSDYDPELGLSSFTFFPCMLADLMDHHEDIVVSAAATGTFNESITDVKPRRMSVLFIHMTISDLANTLEVVRRGERRRFISSLAEWASSPTAAEAFGK